MSLDLTTLVTRPPPRPLTLILFAIALTQLLAVLTLNIFAINFSTPPFVWLEMFLSCYIIPLTLTASLIDLARHYQAEPQVRPRGSWMVWTNAILNLLFPLVTMTIALYTD